MACSCCPRVQVSQGARRREAVGFLLAMAAVLLGVLAAVLTSGCKAGGSAGDYAPLIRSGTALAVGQGWSVLARRNPADLPQLRVAAAETADVIERVILPALDGAGSDVVTRAAVDQALAALDAKIPAELRPWIRAGIDLVLSRVQLPQIPTDRLDPQARALIVAFFSGAAGGTRDWLSGGGAAELATASVYGARAIAPAPRAWSGPLTWRIR